MAFVSCPTCGEKGRLHKELVGRRIKCQKCGLSFLVEAPGRAPAVPSPVVARAAAVGSDPDTIAVDGLEDSAWTAPAGDAVAVVPDDDHDASTASFTAAHEPHPNALGVREYKVLTSKDKFFGAKFELAQLEAALNHYAQQGWVVRSMATPHITGFSGGPREELVILLER